MSLTIDSMSLVSFCYMVEISPIMLCIMSCLDVFIYVCGPFWSHVGNCDKALGIEFCFPVNDSLCAD